MDTLKDASMTTFAPHLQVIHCGDERVVFSRGVNIGLIEEEIFMVKKDFFTGGSKNTVYTEQDINVITQSMKLKGATTKERIQAIADATIELNEIKATLKKEKDLTSGTALLERSRTLAREFGNETNVEIATENEMLYKKAFPPAGKVIAPAAAADPGAAVIKAAKEKDLKRLNEIKEAITKQKTKKAAKELLAEATEIMHYQEVNYTELDPDANKAFKSINRKFSNL